MSDSQKPKNTDEFYCSSCGELINGKVEVCPKCGLKYNFLARIIGGGYSVASLILGIFGLIFLGALVIPEIIGLILGIKGLKTDKKGMAVVGIVLNSIQIFLLIIIAVIIAVVLKINP